jgi:DNA recombination protein RmuC
MSISALALALAALALGAVVGAVIARAFHAGRRNAADAAATMETVLRQVDQSTQSLNSRLDTVTGEMNRTFAHALQQATQSLTGSIGTVREETRAAIHEKFVQVTDRLGDLKATNERIMEFSRSLDEFQRMLQSPKLRGDFGEFTLEQMLRDLLPIEHWDVQAPIGSARVDAIVRTPYGVLCIDCKFPLDNFRRALDATEPVARESALKNFYADVRGRIDEIADRYVAPPITLEMAFMFVPAENVFYELIGRPELLAYGRERKVVLVSPNTMYAYIQVLAVGFRGMKIQDEARRVQEIIADLGTRFGRFQDHFNMIGKHLENAKTQFDRALRDVQRLEATLDGVKVGRLEEVQQPLLDPHEPV